MKTFDQVWDETEGKTRTQNEIICKTIILELEKECNIHFPIEEANITYSGFLPVFLFDSHYIEYREKLLEIMEKYPIEFYWYDSSKWNSTIIRKNGRKRI